MARSLRRGSVLLDLSVVAGASNGQTAAAAKRMPTLVDSCVILGWMSVEVKDNAEDQQYEVFSDGRLAGFAKYRLGGRAITIYHTEIGSEFEGHGIGAELAKGALADVRAKGLDLIPLCPFISRYIRRHPDEYLDLVAPRIRESWAEAD